MERSVLAMDNGGEPPEVRVSARNPDGTPLVEEITLNDGTTQTIT